MKRHLKFLVNDSSISGEIRRALNSWSQDLNFDEVQTGKISIVVNELVTNILKHASRGEIIAIMDQDSLSVLAIDKGPGIPDVNAALKDGFSTHGTAGNGLGAIKRLSSEFDLFSQDQKGTIVLAKFNTSTPPKTGFQFYGFSLPLSGETVSGDSWSDKHIDHTTLLVSDGLGHGVLAHEASLTAVRTYLAHPRSQPFDLVNTLHLALRSTRGAAIAVARVDEKKSIVEYCGLGNIAGTIVGRSTVKRLISYNGTAGVQMRKTQSLPYPIDKDSLLILHSDGLATHWSLTPYVGLQVRHPLIVAAVLYRDFTRGNDDVTVVVGHFQ
jgi:anti-sigma regulatory factor (Ser/Thr protein kinase)